MNDNSIEFIDIYKVFNQFPGLAPTNLDEVAILEESCRKDGRDALAEYLFDWRIHMEYQILCEWELFDEEDA